MSDKAKKFFVLIGLSLMGFTGYLDATIVSTALPSIQKSLQMSVTQLQWIMNAFFIGLSACMMIMGSVADNLGRRKILYIGVIVFALASVGAGFSHSAYWLIFFRAIQGITTAVTIPVSIINIFHVFPEAEAPKAIAVFSAITGAGLALGPLIGGVLVSWFGWPAIFFVNVPFVIIGFFFCISLKESRTEKPVALDYFGIVFLVVTIVAFTYGIVQIHQYGWGSGIVIGSFVIAVIGLLCLIVAENKVNHPIISGHLLRNAVLLKSILFAIVGGGMMAMILFIMPLYLHNILQFTTYMTGVLLFVMPLIVIVSSYLLGGVISRYGTKPVLIVGSLAYLLVCLLQFALGNHISYWMIGVTFVLFGLGWGIFNVAPSIAVSNAVENESNGVALGMLYSSYNVGAAVMLAVGVSLFSWRALTNLVNSGMYAAQQLPVLHRFVSHPDQIGAVTQQLTTIPDVRFHLSNAFVSGMHVMFWPSLVLAIIVFLGFVMLRRS